MMMPEARLLEDEAAIFGRSDGFGPGMWKMYQASSQMTLGDNYPFAMSARM